MKKFILVLVVIFLSFGSAVVAADLIIDSKTQSYNEKENKIKIEGDVKVQLDNLHVVGEKADITVNEKNKLDTATFYDKPYAYQVENNKKREVKANILKVSLITKVVRAEGDTQSIYTDGKNPLVMITAESQEYDLNTNVMTAEGGVIINYKDIQTFSDKAVIKTDKKGDIQKFDLFGNAKIQEKSNDAEADHFSYNAKTEELLAEGNAKTHTVMEDGKSLTIKARYQQFSKKQNIFNAGGNVQVWYDTYYAKGPKMVVYPDKTTNKFNEIYFNGRSLINDNDKTIYADKIRMMLNPKDFHAEGNTRTVIRNVSSSSSSFGDNK